MNNTIDLEVATEITDYYELPLNKLKPPAVNRLSEQESYISWKILCLGVYHPFAYSNCGPQYNIVFLSGGGAENHRPLYPYKDTNSFIRKHSSDIQPRFLRFNFIKDFDSEFVRLNTKKSNMTPMVHHYREYRNRIHAGRNPQYRTTFNPLGSKLLDALSEVAGSERIANGQVNYDIMATLLPSILNIRFDSPAKSLTADKEKELTKLKSWQEFEPGRIYADLNKPIPVSTPSDSRLSFLKADLEKAVNNDFVKDFFEESFINDALSSMELAISNKGFPHSVEARGISAILVASWFE